MLVELFCTIEGKFAFMACSASPLARHRLRFQAMFEHGYLPQLFVYLHPCPTSVEFRPEMPERFCSRRALRGHAVSLVPHTV